MNPIRRKALEDSIKAFASISGTTLPKILSGNFLSCENNVDDHNSIEFKLDSISGIDYLVENDIGLRGLAVRIQFGTPYCTFTIRSKRNTGTRTEEAKRLDQIEGGYIYPYWTLQCYFTKSENPQLISMAVVRTTDLYEYLENGENIGDAKSNNDFKYIHFQDLPKEKIRIWQRKPST